MAEVIYRKNSYILLVDDVILTVYKVMSFNIRSPLLKTQDRSVETLGRECNLGVEISFIFNVTRVALIMSDYISGCNIFTNFSSLHEIVNTLCD